MQWCALPTSPMRPSREPVGDPELPQRAVARAAAPTAPRRRAAAGPRPRSGGCARPDRSPRRRSTAARSAPARRGRSAGGSAARGRAGRRCARTGCRSPGAGRPRAASNVAAHPTCMCALGPSTARNDASSAESRSGGMGSPRRWFRPQSLAVPRSVLASQATRRAGLPDVRLQTLTSRSDVARERVARGRVAVLEAALEPAGALLRRAVGEGLRADPARGLRPGCGRRRPTRPRSAPPPGRPRSSRPRSNVECAHTPARQSACSSTRTDSALRWSGFSA